MPVSLIVLSEEESSLPAATCASFVQPVGTFFVPSGKKLIVRAGQAADASCTEAAERKSARQGREKEVHRDMGQKLSMCPTHACAYRFVAASTSRSSNKQLKALMSAVRDSAGLPCDLREATSS